MGKETGIGLGPSGFVEGAGLLDNVDVKFKKVRFEMFDYGGKSISAVPALKIEMEQEDGSSAEQYFSAGSAADWSPSKDGTKLVSVGNARGINKGCNMAILINSIIEAGFPEDKITDDCTVFEGMEVHVIRVKAPERKGIVKQPRADGKEYEQTNLVVDAIHKLPWETKKGGSKGTSKASTGASNEESEGEESFEDKMFGIVLGVLSDAGDKPIDKKALSQKVFVAMKGDADRNKGAQMAFNDEFLSSGPWDFDGEKVKL